MLQETPQQRIRRDALKRITPYSHPPLVLTEHPINPKDCQQLQEQLSQLLRPKLEQVRFEGSSLLKFEDLDKQYEQKYTQFAHLTTAKDIQQQHACDTIKQLHEINDILVNPPALNPKGDVYLYFRQPPSLLEEEQIEKIFKKYQDSYKNEKDQGSDQANKAIMRARTYLLTDK